MGRGVLILSRLRTASVRGAVRLQQQRRWFELHSQVGPNKEEFAAIKGDLFGELCRENVRILQQFPLPDVTNPKVQEKRSALFSKEKEKQHREVGRITKITVDFKNDKHPESASLVMNKGVSTPYHCAQHLGEIILNRSIVAEVNGHLWDMHRPLEESCSLRLLHMKMKDEDPYQANRVFWRSCSFMLGATLESVFREHIYVELHSFPSPNVRSGSFVYDVDLKLKNWTPNSDEARMLSAGMIQLSRKRLPFERLEVDIDLAAEMFQDNKFKSQQIPEIAQSSSNGRTICLYRIGNFVDISKGPMMTNTGHLNKCTITAVHPLPQATEISPTLYRVQGVALPDGVLLNHFAYGIIEQRGRKFNSARLPGSIPQISSGQEQSYNQMLTDGKIRAEAVG